MTSQHENVALLRTAYVRWSESRGRSIEDWLAIIGPDFRTHSAADRHAEGRFGAVPAGREGLKVYLEDLVANWIMESHDVTRFVADGDEVVAVIRAVWRNRRTNKQIATDVVDLWTFKGGKAAAMLEMFDTAAMIEAATPDAA